MPRTPYSISAESRGYRVSIPRPRGAGAVRKWFPSEPEALAWADANFSSIRRANPEPLTPAEVAEYRAARSLLPDDASLIDAARAYARSAPRTGPLPADRAISLYIESRRAANLRPVSIHNAERHLRRLAGVGDLSRLAPADLESLLVGLSPRSRNQVVAHFRALFGWLVVRGILQVNPALQVDLARTDYRPPAIYTPAQAAAIMRHAEASVPAIVAHLALALFAGIRSSGLLRLPTASVSLAAGSVLVPGAADKLRRSYLITMADVPNLRPWLEAWPYARTELTSRQIDERIKRVCRLAGVQRVPNGFRHSFGTYFYALTGDPIRTSAALGHFGGTATLLSHYRAMASPAQAAEYFAILPESNQAENASRVKP